MRVRFVLNSFDLGSGAQIAAAREVFGKRVSRWANCSQDLVIECSADRFVRFQVRRNELGATNGFKNLKLEIISPVPAPSVVTEVFD
jgi:hypothetical protein